MNAVRWGWCIQSRAIGGWGVGAGWPAYPVPYLPPAVSTRYHQGCPMWDERALAMAHSLTHLSLYLPAPLSLWPASLRMPLVSYGHQSWVNGEPLRAPYLVIVIDGNDDTVVGQSRTLPLLYLLNAVRHINVQSARQWSVNVPNLLCVLGV